MTLIAAKFRKYSPSSAAGLVVFQALNTPYIPINGFPPNEMLFDIWYEKLLELSPSFNFWLHLAEQNFYSSDCLTGLNESRTLD